MPTYDFKCECGYAEEFILLMSERNFQRVCPKCFKRMLRILGTGSGFKITGQGVYKQGWSWTEQKKKGGGLI